MCGRVLTSLVVGLFVRCMTMKLKDYLDQRLLNTKQGTQVSGAACAALYLLTLWFCFPAGMCRGLQKLDLRGFKLTVSALRRLASANATTLKEVTLPAGVSQLQLERLLEPLQVLQHLRLGIPADGSGTWCRLLPKSLEKLEITGELPLDKLETNGEMALKKMEYQR